MSTSITQQNEQMIRAFSKRIRNMVLSESLQMDAEFFRSDDHVPFEDRLSGDYLPIKEGASWGATWDSAWFHLRGRVPEEWRGRKVVAELDFNGEGLVFSEDGVPLQGITNGSVFDGRESRCIFNLFDSCNGGEQVELWVEAAANSLFGANRRAGAGPESPFRYGHYQGKVCAIRLRVMDEVMWHFMIDFTALGDLMPALPEESVRRARIRHALCNATAAFKDDAVNAAAAAATLKDVLDCPASASDMSASAPGSVARFWKNGGSAT